MYEQQLDLFSSAGAEAERSLPLSMELCPAATVLDDQALIAAIPGSNLADSIALAAEAGRRRLAAARRQLLHRKKHLRFLPRDSLTERL